MPFIRPGDRPYYTSVSGGPWYSKTLGELMQEVAQLAGGYEMRFTYTEPRTSYTYWTGTTDASTTAPTNVPAIAEVTWELPPSAPPERGEVPIFEYGTTRANVVSYNLTVDRDSQANHIYVPRVGFPEPGYTGALGTKEAIDATGIAGFGKLQAWVDPSNIELDTYRQRLADTHLALRKAPRRRVTLTPSRNNTVQPWEDYYPGDWIRFLAFHGTTVRLNVLLRIYAINVSLDDAGNELVELQTIEDTG